MAKQVHISLILNYSDNVSDDYQIIAKEVVEFELNLKRQQGHFDLGKNELESIKVEVESVVRS